MTSKLYYIVKVSLPNESVPDKIFVRQPDGRLVEDERSAEEIERAAAACEGKNGVVEVAIHYTGPHAPNMRWKDYEQMERAAIAIMKAKGHRIEDKWKDIEVEPTRRIVLYTK